MNKIDKLIKKLERKYMYIGKSSIQGVGLFALYDIPKHTVIHRFLPEIGEFSIKELETFLKPEAIRDLKMKYYFEDDRIFLDIDLKQDFILYLNHSEKSNIRYDEGYYVTTKDIKKNEEILLNWLDNGYHPKLRNFDEINEKI